MKIPELFNPKKNNHLFELKNEFNFIKKLIKNNNLPKVILLTGDKGIGKSTLVNHVLHFFFDRKNYNEETCSYELKTPFNIQFSQNIFPNIIFLGYSQSENVKIDDVRNLRNQLNKTTIDNNKRFVVFDDVEKFNLNSLNGLLKIIEEPGINNHFILINNKSTPILDTIRSRCFELKIILQSEERNRIITKLIDHFEQKIILDKNLVKISPGNFLKFNNNINEKKIDIEGRILTNFKNLMNLYKKDKEIIYKEILIFFAEYYLQNIFQKGLCSKERFIKSRSLTVKNINEFFLYNLNQNTLISSIEDTFTDE